MQKGSSSSNFSSWSTGKVEDNSLEECRHRRCNTHERTCWAEDNVNALETSDCKHQIKTEGWKLRIVASSRCTSPSHVASDVIGSIDFNGDGELFATGGIARKIRICSYSKMVSETEEKPPTSEDDDDLADDDYSTKRKPRRRRGRNSIFNRDHGYASVGEICTPGKLSSLKWRPDGSEVIGCGDYDGVVSEWNIEYAQTVSERYEHSGLRVWSLDYSRLVPTLSASSSADGTVRLWSRETDKSVAILRPRSGNSVCSAEFSPVVQHLIAVASADAHVYLHDLRKPDTLLLKLSGHDKAVSYVRFLGKDNIVSASIDSTLRLWDISARTRDVEVVGVQSGSTGSSSSGVGAHLVRIFNAHANVRNFVGLSVHRGAGILACGSETDEVFMYRNSSTVPLLRHKFPCNVINWSSSAGDCGKSFVGAVCWREQGDDYSLVAANSEGVVQVLQTRPL